MDSGGEPNMVNPAVLQQLLEVVGQVQRDNADLRAQLASVVRDQAREAKIGVRLRRLLIFSRLQRQ